jgi:hypothetical protein
MTLIIESIMKKFTNTIEVDVNATTFTFICNENMLQLGTFIDVNNENGKDVVVGVGGDEPSSGQYIRVKLFGKTESNVQPTNKLDYLDAFFRYANEQPRSKLRGIENSEQLKL